MKENRLRALVEDGDRRGQMNFPEEKKAISQDVTCFISEGRDTQCNCSEDDWHSQVSSHRSRQSSRYDAPKPYGALKVSSSKSPIRFEG